MRGTTRGSKFGRGNETVESGQANFGLIIGIVIVSFIVLAIGGCAGCNSIAPGHVGIEVSKTGPSRGVQDVSIRTGWVLINPITTEIIEYPIYMQTVKWTAAEHEGNSEADESITFTTKDSMIVNADISVSYELAADKAPEFYVKFRADDINKFTDGYLRNVVRNSFNEAAGNYNVEQIMGDNADLLKAVKNDVTSQVKAYGITIDQLGFIGAPRPPKVVLDSINSKVQAAQIALQKQNEVAQATADAQKQVAYAEGNAKAAIANAEGQAKANQLLTSSLSPTLIEWRKLDIQSKAVDKWNGVRPHVEAGSGGLLIDVK